MVQALGLKLPPQIEVDDFLPGCRGWTSASARGSLRGCLAFVWSMTMKGTEFKMALMATTQLGMAGLHQGLAVRKLKLECKLS
jgi:hypothetical protein